MSAIRAELMKAAKITPKRGESEADVNLRIAKAISEEADDDTWNGLSSAAQDWNNGACDDVTAGKPIRAFPDAAASPTSSPASDAPEKGRRGSRAAAAGKPASHDPKIGDRVVITTKRGKVVEGVIVEMDEEGYVLNKDGDSGDEANDTEVPIGTVAALALSNTPEAAEAGASTEVGGEPPEPEIPEVGDTLKVTTKRGKVVTGILTEQSGEANDDIVIKDSTGEEHELQVSKLQSFEIKAKGKKPEASGRKRVGDGAKENPVPPANTTATDAKPAGRRRGGAAAPAEEEAGAKGARASNKGTSVSTRVSETMLDHPDWSLDQVSAALKKEGLDFRDNTLQLNYSANKKIIDLMKARKLIS